MENIDLARYVFSLQLVALFFSLPCFWGIAEAKVSFKSDMKSGKCEA